MKNFHVVVTFLVVGWLCACSKSDERVIQNKLGDAEIVTAVKAKLAADEGLRTVTDVHVTASNGVVTLAGEVADPHDSAKAEELARSVHGVAHVNNELHVETASRDHDREERSRRVPAGRSR
jgi:hypothetical protein